MPRVTVNPRGDLEEPVVGVSTDASAWERRFAWLLRSYLVFAAVIAALAGVGLVFLIVLLSL
jgi:hypothetical protein